MAIAFSSIAEPITGSRIIQNISGEGMETGPLFFGYLPEGEIIEVATATKSHFFIDTSRDVPIPMPIYEDGTSATLIDLIFTIRFNGFNPSEYGGYIEATWDGLQHATITQPSMSPASIEVRVWAFRQGSVGAESLDFGMLKTMFE
ncbi:hypothetical protein H8E52_04495 [bacterium]|nr:hypothetical protein [bacterium]